MINWNALDSRSNSLAYRSMQRVITLENYGTGDGQWTLTELVQTDDTRRYFAFHVLDGVNEACVRVHDVPPLLGPDTTPFKFKFQVMSRQACCRSSDGKVIFQSRQAFDENDDDGLLPNHDDKPMPGDVVEWKKTFQTYDIEKNRKVTGKVLQEWALRGIRPELYNEYVVDKDHCIWVPYPYALSMLTRKGRNLSFPHFRKQPRGKNVRRITNWCFREVPQDFKLNKK